MHIETINLWPDRKDVRLTAFVNKPDPFFKDKNPRPAVLIFPGGGYAVCNRHSNEGDNVAAAFAMDGYQAFVLEYSVTTRAPEGKTVYPAMILDYGKAVQTIREHSSEWNVNPKQISILGFSAGGHLCGVIATSWNNGLLKDAYGVPSEVFRPLCAMMIYPVADLVQHEQSRKDKLMTSGKSNMITAWFGDKEPDETDLKAASPSYNVTIDCPPVFLAAAQDDKMVDSMCALNMATALQRSGIPYELHLFQNGGHCFGIGRNRTDPCRDDLAYTASSWLRDAKTFLLHQYAPETAAHEKCW